MIAVAVAAAALGAHNLRERAARFRSLRSTHEWEGFGCQFTAEQHTAVAAANEREVARLRAADVLDPTGLRSQVIASITGQAAVERAAERKDLARARFHH